MNRFLRFLNFYRIPILTLTVLVFFLTGWEILVRLWDVSPHILPTPSAIFTTCYAKYNVLLPAIGVTAIECLLGLILGSGLAIILSISFLYVPILEEIAYPYAVAVKAVPVVAISPLLILWFGNGLFSKVIMAALICFFPVLVNATTGLRQISSEALNLFQTLSASRTQILIHLRIPSSAPYLFSSLKVGSTLSVVGAIVAELAGADKGIGFVLMVAALQLDTTLLFSALIFISLFGVSLFWALALLERKILDRLHLRPVN